MRCILHAQPYDTLDNNSVSVLIIIFCKDFSMRVELDPPLDSTPLSLAKGDTYLFVVKAYITEPHGMVEFSVIQPLGFNVSHPRSIGCDNELLCA